MSFSISFTSDQKDAKEALRKAVEPQGAVTPAEVVRAIEGLFKALPENPAFDVTVSANGHVDSHEGTISIFVGLVKKA